LLGQFRNLLKVYSRPAVRYHFTISEVKSHFSRVRRKNGFTICPTNDDLELVYVKPLILERVFVLER
jgi:hypothetical protein